MLRRHRRHVTITKITILEWFTSSRLLFIPVAYETDEVFMQGKFARKKIHGHRVTWRKKFIHCRKTFKSFSHENKTSVLEISPKNIHGRTIWTKKNAAWEFPHLQPSLLPKLFSDGPVHECSAVPLSRPSSGNVSGARDNNGCCQVIFIFVPLK